eukprot:TRINITY_DN29614_c0_g1_i1.p1 TRINITY_DN29614_c0_g1~~TRINITY_DN29614_c0_g1_i1.p1  ORF type:complete len:650 (-),score=126.09 TRINITY_DN29614_c0_g1_i1:58-2007(-)
MGRGWRRRRGAGGRGGSSQGRRARSFVVETEAAEDEQDEPASIEESALTGEQRAAAQRALQGESLFLTGAAGTGKSFLLKFLVQELESRHPGQVAVTAPTGIAAANIGGQTIHSFSGVGFGTGSLQKLLAKVRKSSAALARWQALKVLVLDEVSMLDAGLFEALEAIAARVRGVREQKGRLAAFGGIQLILCGDFLQLPPVRGRGESAKAFCFQTPAWSRCGLERGTVILREQVRQAGDAAFAEVLNEVRVGTVSASAEAMLAACHVDTKPVPDDGIVPTKLYCLNRNVDAENKKQLMKLPGDLKTFRARDSFKGVRNPRQRASLQEMMEKKMPAQLQLKVGAQVILTKNNPALKLVNGSRGVVDSFSDGYPLVRFDSGCIARIGQESLKQGTSANSVTRVQVPLKLGWALTVHKAQGMTLSRAELQVDDAFEAGQVYVALSRLTGADGLWIRGHGLSRCNTRADNTVLDFYGASPKPIDLLALKRRAPVRAGSCEAQGSAGKFRRLRRGTAPPAELEVILHASVPSPSRSQRGMSESPKKDSALAAREAAGSDRLPSRSTQKEMRPACATTLLLDERKPSRAALRNQLRVQANGRSAAAAAPLAADVVSSDGRTEAVPSSSHASDVSERFAGWIDPPRTWGGGVICLD